MVGKENLVMEKLMTALNTRRIVAMTLVALMLLVCACNNSTSFSSGGEEEEEEKEHRGVNFLPPVKEYKDRAGGAAAAIEGKSGAVHKQFEMLDK